MQLFTQVLELQKCRFVDAETEDIHYKGITNP